MLALAPLILQALPTLLQTGFSVYSLIQHTNANPSPAPTPVETFAAQLLGQLPNLMSAGVDVLGLVKDGAARVALMVKENRGPTDAEKADQTARLAQLDANYDAAAK